MGLPALATTTRKCNQSAHRIPYNDCAAHRIPYNDRASPSAVRASHPVQRPRSASRKCNLSVEVRASYPVQRPRIALRGPRIALRGPHTLRSTLRWFRLVRGTIFSKIQYIYIFIPENLTTNPSYWLRCENLICGPRFESGTRPAIVIGPRRRPRCNDNFSTAEK